LAVLNVQLAYCQQLAGQLEVATNLYTEVLKTKYSSFSLSLFLSLLSLFFLFIWNCRLTFQIRTSDQVALAVAANNSVALKKGQSPFDSMKRLNSAAPEAVEQKLTSAQRKTLEFNRTVLLLHTGKV
jgi:hypothetical protein